MSTDLATVNGVTIDHQAVLKALKLNPSDPNTQALLVVCDRYGLDPLLKHMVLIQGTPYITRDGYLAVAHRSGVFDGMEVLEQSSDGTHHIAKVAVYRKDMSHPFTFVGRFPKNKPMAKEYGPEMAVKVAEVQALRRAFNVTGVSAADERWDQIADETPTLPSDATPGPSSGRSETGQVLNATVRRPSPQSAAPPTPIPDNPEFDVDPPDDAFTAADMVLVSADTRRSWVADCEQGGFDESVQAAIVHRATKGRTDVLKLVEKSEWDVVLRVTQALIEGKLREAIVDGAVRLHAVEKAAVA